MINKQNLKQRTISDLNIETKETKNEIGLRLIEGRLSVNVARIGSMYPYVKVIFGTEIWKSESSSTGGMHPKWNGYHLFEILSQTLEIIVYDKVFLFEDAQYTWLMYFKGILLNDEIFFLQSKKLQEQCY